MNTYGIDAKNDFRIAEELRLIRCVLERILRVQSEALFVDYQMEKFTADHIPISMRAGLIAEDQRR